MATSFELVAGDFLRELYTVRRLLERAYGKEGSEIDSEIRIAASNASILLLAASFEEFIRQLVEECAQRLISSALKFSDLPDELPSAVWERSIQVLRGLRYGQPDFEKSKASLSIETLSRFCLDQDYTLNVARVIAFNQNNMRAREINSIFKRVGVSDICRKVGKRAQIVGFFGAVTEDKSHAAFVLFVDRFYSTRNDVAHSIGSLRVTGETDIVRFLDFFEALSSAITDELGVSFANVATGPAKPSKNTRAPADLAESADAGNKG